MRICNKSMAFLRASFLFYEKAKSRIEKDAMFLQKKLVFSGGESLCEIIRIAVGQW